MSAFTTIEDFLSVSGFSQELRDLVNVVDMEGSLVMIHHTDEGTLHPVARTIRGWIYDVEDKQVVVKGETDYEDVRLTDELMEEIDPSYLCVGRQLTHLRIYKWKEQVRCSTNKKLNAFKSYWGIRGKSFGDMLLESGQSVEQIHETKDYNDNGAIDVFLECPDNQLVVNASIGEITRTSLYDRAQLLGMSLALNGTSDVHEYQVPDKEITIWASNEMKDFEDCSITDDICWVDHVNLIRYLSPSMWDKLYTVRNCNEPNLLRRLLVLKGSGSKLVSIVPSDQRAYLENFIAKKRDLISALFVNPPNQLVESARRNNASNMHEAFNKLPGITQYRMLFEPNSL